MVLAGCAQKATRCSSQRMNGLLKSKISEIVGALPSAGVDLIAAGVIRNIRVEDIETDDAGDDGGNAVCRATLRFELDGKPIEHSFQYLVIKQDGDDIYRTTGAWPVSEWNKQLKVSAIAPLLEKEKEIAALEQEMSDDRAQMRDIQIASQDSAAEDSENTNASQPTAAEAALISNMRTRTEARAKKLESVKSELESMRRSIRTKNAE